MKSEVQPATISNGTELANDHEQSTAYGAWLPIVRWFDLWAGIEHMRTDQAPSEVDWLRAIPLIVVHVLCLAVFVVGWSWTAVCVAIGFYFIRMFAITGWYHRYFSHRTFKTSRVCQFAFAVLGASSAQRGPLWWSGHHRHHHVHSDQPLDTHSVRQGGFLWAHMGWISSKKFFPPRLKSIRDFAIFPELRFVDRFATLVPAVCGLGLFGLGDLLDTYAPGLGTNGPQLLIWGFFVSTVALLRGTCMINSLSHVYGTQRYNTGDDSKNNFFLALITLGEGWHNNHHHYAASTRQGFYWWEIDITYYLLRTMQALGLIWDIREVPARVREGKISSAQLRNRSAIDERRMG